MAVPPRLETKLIQLQVSRSLLIDANISTTVFTVVEILMIAIKIKLSVFLQKNMWDLGTCAKFTKGQYQATCFHA